MAVSRQTPACPYCGKDLARAIHKNYSDLPRFVRPIGDSFIRWEWLNHTCKGQRKAEKEWQKKIKGLPKIGLKDLIKKKSSS